MEDSTVSEIIEIIIEKACANAQPDFILLNTVSVDSDRSNDSSDESIIIDDSSDDESIIIDEELSDEESSFDEESTDESEAVESDNEATHENNHCEELQREEKLEEVQQSKVAEVNELRKNGCTSEAELHMVQHNESKVAEDNELRKIGCKSEPELHMVQHNENKVAEENDLREIGCTSEAELHMVQHNESKAVEDNELREIGYNAEAELHMVQHNESKVVENNELREIGCKSKAEKCLDTNVALNIRNVSTSKNNFYSDEVILSKGFSLKRLEKVHVLANLSMMSISSQINKCEVECHGLPVQLTENVLLPLFDKFGQVYKIVKVVDSGVVYVSYTNDDDVKKAIAYLHRSVFKGKLINVRRNLTGGQVFVRPIPTLATKREVFERFKAITQGLVKVMVFNDTRDERKIRDFCYLEYSDRVHAIDAKRTLSKEMVFGKRLTVEWPNHNETWSNKMDTVYIHNLRSGIPYSDLRRYFSVYGEVRDIQHNGSFAAIKFYNEVNAMRAANEIDPKLLGNDNVEVSLIKWTKKMLRASSRPAQNIDKQQLGREVDISLEKRTKIKLKKKNVNLSDAVLLKNLPASMTTSDIRKYLSVFGEILEIDKNGNSAAVHFKNPEDSITAAQKIDKQQLGREVEISLEKYEDKKLNQTPNRSHTLFIRKLSTGIPASDLLKYFSVFGEILKIDRDGTSAAVHFKNPEDLMHAAQIDKQQLGCEVEISLEKRTKKKVGKTNWSDTLLIQNLTSRTTTKDLRNNFSVYGEILIIDKPENYATVQFRAVESAKQAFFEFDKQKLGVDVDISFYRKKTDSDTLFIKDLRPGLTTADLKKYLSTFGEICEIDKDKDKATVKFRKLESAKRAVCEMDKTKLGEYAEISF